MLHTNILIASEDIARSTRMGPGNVIVTAQPLDIEINHKVFELSPHSGLGKMLGNRIIIAYRGTRESETGYTLTPYVPVLPIIGTTESDSFKPALKVLSRVGIAEIYGSQNFYKVLEIE